MSGSLVPCVLLKWWLFLNLDYAEIEEKVRKGLPTIPSILKDEIKCNIFLKAKDLESFSKLRDLKDNF